MGWKIILLYIVPSLCFYTSNEQESTGQQNKIQVSSRTAEILIANGKQHWVHRRRDNVHVKGKGILETFFITPPSDLVSSTDLTEDLSDDPSQHYPESPAYIRNSSTIIDIFTSREHGKRQERLVSWMVELFKRRIATIIAHQDPNKVGKCKPQDLIYRVPKGKTSLDEVAAVIKLPTFDPIAAERAELRGEVELNHIIVKQLREIVTAIAAMYQENPFHVSYMVVCQDVSFYMQSSHLAITLFHKSHQSFEHACHVTMAVCVLS